MGEEKSCWGGWKVCSERGEGKKEANIKKWLGWLADVEFCLEPQRKAQLMNVRRNMTDERESGTNDLLMD